MRLMKIAIVSLCAALSCGSVFADKEPSTSHLPTAVQERIKEWKGDGEVKKVKTRKQAGGQTVYEVEYKERGDAKFVVFAEDGSVISESEGKGQGKGRGKEKKEKNKAKNNRSEKQDREEGEEVDNPRAVTRPQSERPAQTTPGSSQPSQTPPAPTTTRPVVRPGTSDNNRTPPTVSRGVGETRYLYWDSIPEAVRTAALAQQAQHGTINTKALQIQKTSGKTVYHVPYEKQMISFGENGSVAQQGGGPLRQTKWDDIPEPARKAALAAQRTSGNVKLDVIFVQGGGRKSLYHVLFGNDVVYAYSADGRVQDPSTYWR